MKRGLFAGTVTLFALALMMDSSVEGGKDKEKEKEKVKDITIKIVMKKAHQAAKKGEKSLLTKFQDGEATAEEKAQLVKLYEALAANFPPKGDKEGWKTKTEALVKAAKANDIAALKAASDCSGCHKEHKKSKKDA
jgi:hypothetical protein